MVEKPTKNRMNTRGEHARYKKGFAVAKIASVLRCSYFYRKASLCKRKCDREGKDTAILLIKCSCSRSGFFDNGFRELIRYDIRLNILTHHVDSYWEENGHIISSGG